MLKLRTLSNRVIGITDESVSPVENQYAGLIKARSEDGAVVVITANGRQFASNYAEITIDGAPATDAEEVVTFVGNFNPAGGTASTTLPGFAPGKHYYEAQAIVVDGVIWTAKAEFDAGEAFDEGDWNKIGVGVDDLAEKLDKLETEGTFAYTHSDGAQGEIPLVADATTPSSVPVRKETTGALAVGAPVAEEDAATKGYVDGKATTLQGNIEAEATARSSADTTLQANIDTEATARENTDEDLWEAIEDETEAREEAIDAANAKIDAFLGKVTYLDAYDFGTDDKDDLQALLTAYAETQHPEWEGAIPNSTGVENKFNGHEWIYNSKTDTWVDFGVAVVQTATNTQQGIVKGTADDGTPETAGKVSVVGGVMSVNGFGDKANKVKFPALAFDGSLLNVAPPRVLRFDVLKTPAVTGMGGQGFVAWQVAGHPFHLFGAWTDGVDGDGKTRIGLFQFQNNELTSVRDIFDGDVWLASDWLLTYGINGTRQDVGTLAGFDFATDMTIPALPDFDLKDVGEYLQKKIATSFGRRTVIVSEADGAILGDETELVTEVSESDNEVPTAGAVKRALDEGGKVQTVDGIEPDGDKNVQTTIALTKAQFDALEDPPGSGLYPSLVGKDVDITDVEYPDGGLMMVPDYDNQEAGNKISTPDGTWTVQRAGFVRMYIGSEASQNKTYNNVFLINGRECYQFYTGGSVVGGSGGRDVIPVNAGDVITAYSYQPSNVPTAIQCYFIPPKLVQKLPPIVVEGNGSYSYSETETKETWVDGRKIYKKTSNVAFPALPQGGGGVAGSIAALCPGAVMIVRAEEIDQRGIAMGPDGFFAFYVGDGTNVVIYNVSSVTSPATPFYLTLYYVKAA